MRITGHTRTFALLGDPVTHSISPALHNAWLSHHGIDGVYVALRSRASGADVANALRTLGLAGANLTVPLKTGILPHLDRVDAAARACGAVNTVVVHGEQLHGFNTDAGGFLDGLAEGGIDPVGRRVAVLGAGGAARAIAWALARCEPAELHLFNRTVSRARALVADLDLDASVSPLTPDAFAAFPADLVVHTLPGPARAAVAALPTDHLPDDAAWCDLNYWDSDPPHLGALRARGHPVQTGHAMLLHQAARAFVHFTGTSPTIDVARSALVRTPRGQ